MHRHAICTRKARLWWDITKYQTSSWNTHRTSKLVGFILAEILAFLISGNPIIFVLPYFVHPFYSERVSILGLTCFPETCMDRNILTALAKTFGWRRDGWNKIPLALFCCDNFNWKSKTPLWHYRHISRIWFWIGR